MVVGIVFGNYLSQPRKPRVIKIAPESGRGVEYEVDEENAANVYCKAVGKTPPQRFIKLYPAMNILRKGWFKLTQYPLWFGRFGTAYTYTLGSENLKTTLKATIENLFGADYAQIPQPVKNQIELGNIGVTIELPKGGLTPEGLPSISEDDINRDNDERAMKNLWDSQKKAGKSQFLVQSLPWIGVGMAIALILVQVFGWGPIKVVEVGR